jgi:hypothetical protein
MEQTNSMRKKKKSKLHWSMVLTILSWTHFLPVPHIRYLYFLANLLNHLSFSVLNSKWAEITIKEVIRDNCKCDNSSRTILRVKWDVMGYICPAYNKHSENTFKISFSFFFFLMVLLEFALRASHLLGRCSITWATAPALFCFFSYFSDRVFLLPRWVQSFHS